MRTSNFGGFNTAGEGLNTTMLPMNLGDTSFGDSEPEDIRSVLERLEQMQFYQRSAQMPNPELDKLIVSTFARRPEWRMRMAVMTKSPWLRKKMLQQLPPGARGCGSATLGNSHPWRNPKLADEFSDHSWPKVQVNEKGDYHIPGGTAKHGRLLRAPVDKQRMDPIISHSAYYSVPKAKRFQGTHHNGELSKAEVQKRGTPGPGSYFKTIPRGVAFSADNGETVVFGANHICPWKGALGHHINPVDVDHSAMNAQPKWSFPKSRRSVSETMSGHGLQDGGPVKTDLGCLSPGPIYEHYGSQRPNVGRALSLKPKRSRSTPHIDRVRSYPVEMPPEEKPDNVSGGGTMHSVDGTRNRGYTTG
jgi:hypothetical protein